MGTDPAADSGQHIIPANQSQRLFVFALSSEGNIALSVDAKRTVFLAKWLFAFVDIRSSWQAGPGEITERLTLFRMVDRAGCRAFAAEGATVRVDEGLFLCDMDTESLLGMLDRADTRRQQGADSVVTHNPDQARSVGIVEGEARWQAIFLGSQLTIKIGFGVDQRYWNSQLAKFVGGSDALRSSTSDQHPIQAFLLSAHGKAPLWPLARFSRPFRVDSP